MMTLAVAGRAAFRHVLVSRRFFLMESRRNGSQNKHAAEYRSRFCVHESTDPVRYFMKIGPNDQNVSVPAHAKVAEASNFPVFVCPFTKALRVIPAQLVLDLIGEQESKLLQ